MNTPQDTLLTPAPALAVHTTVRLTGNTWVFLPDISPEDGSLATCNVLSARANGLVEPRGTPLLWPTLWLDGGEAPLRNLAWDRLEAWVPRFTWRSPQMTVRGVICAPEGHRGFVYLLEVEAHRAVTARLALDLRWEDLAVRVFSGRSPEGARELWWDSWTQSRVGDWVGEAPLAALAVGLDGPADLADVSSLPAHPLRVPNDGRPLAGSLGRALQMVAGETATVAWYMAVAPKRDGARTRMMDLRRHGWPRSPPSTSTSVRPAPRAAASIANNWPSSPGAARSTTSAPPSGRGIACRGRCPPSSGPAMAPPSWRTAPSSGFRTEFVVW